MEPVGSCGLWKAGLDGRFWLFRNACASPIFPQFAGPGDKQECLFKGNLKSHFLKIPVTSCLSALKRHQWMCPWMGWPLLKARKQEDCPVPRGRMCRLTLFSLLAEWRTVVDSEGYPRPTQVWLRLSQTLASTFVLRSPCELFAPKLLLQWQNKVLYLPTYFVFEL